MPALHLTESHYSPLLSVTTKKNMISKTTEKWLGIKVWSNTAVSTSNNAFICSFVDTIMLLSESLCHVFLLSKLSLYLKK